MISQTIISKWIMISISGCSMFIYGLAVASIFLGQFKSIGSLVSLQLIITCFCHNFAFFLSTNTMCTVQTFFNAFGEIGKLSVTMTIMFISLITFTDELQSKNKKLFVIISIILSWVISIVVCFFCVFFGGTIPYTEFCWIAKQPELNIYTIIRLIIIAIAIGFSITIYNKVKSIRRESALKDNDNLILFQQRIKRYCIILNAMCCIYVIYTVIDLLLTIIDLTSLYPTIDILNTLSSPVFVIVFVYTKEKMKLVYNKILCKESEEDDDTEENNDGIDLAEHLETE